MDELPQLVTAKPGVPQSPTRRVNAYGVLVAVALLAVLSVTLIVSLTPSRADVAALPPWLRDAAVEAAASCGEEEPASLDWGLMTTEEASALVDGRQVEPQADETATDCWVAIVHGEFRYEPARGLLSAAQEGTWIMLLIDVESRETIAFAIGDGSLDTTDQGALQSVSLTASATSSE